MVRDALQPKGYRVDMVDGGDEALAACQRPQPDLLVVASRLPKMDGFVFMTKLRSEGFVIPVIMIADGSEKRRAALAKKRGVGAYLVSPIRVRELIEQVSALTSARALGALATREAREQERLKLVAKKQAEGAAKAKTAAAKPRRFKRKDLDAVSPEPVVPRRVGRPRAAVSAGRAKDNELLHELGETLARMKRLDAHGRLELELGADGAAVARAFRQAAVRLHPDRYKGKSRAAHRIAQDIYLLVVEAKNELSEAASPSLQGSLESDEIPGDVASAERASREPAVQPSRAGDEPEAPELVLETEEPDASAEPDEPELVLETEEPEAPAEPEGPELPLEIDKPAVPELLLEVETPAVPAEPTAAEKPAAPAELRLGGEASQAFAEPVATEEPYEDADERCEQAMEALAQGHYRDAKNQLKLLVNHGHTTLEILVAQRLAQGHLCRVEGDLKEALAHFEAAVELAPIAKTAKTAKTAISQVQALQESEPLSLFDRLLGKS